MTTNNSCSSEFDILKDIYSLLNENNVFYSKNSENVPVVRFNHPHELKKIFDFKIESNGIDDKEKIKELCKMVIDYSVKTGLKQFRNQLFGAVDPYALAGSWITEALNTSQYTYEVAPIFTLMEMELINIFTKLFGFENGDGIFTPGGSISNMYGMVLARHQAIPNIKETGLFNGKRLIAFTSEEAHYSIKKSISWLGIGTENLITIKTNQMGCMVTTDLEMKIIDCLANGWKPFFVNATCGTTVYGSFDNLIEISRICKKYHIWMHVDACLGGSIILSKRYKYLLDGIQLANSISWNPHKTLGVPLQCSMFLVNEKLLLDKCNSSKASYLFQQDKFYDVAYDTGDKSIQCGRKVDSFKFWLMLKVRGFNGIEKLLDDAMDLSKYLTAKIRNTNGFRLCIDEERQRSSSTNIIASIMNDENKIVDSSDSTKNAEHQYTNICFWYMPLNARNQDENTEWWQSVSTVTTRIKEKLMRNGILMIGYSPLESHGFVNFFRMVLTCHPNYNKMDMDELLNAIEYAGENLY